MNMRLPKFLWDRDPLLCNVPMLEVQMEPSEAEWMAEELENFERQMEQELLEEEFIAACFEEMLAEEEAQWHHFTGQIQASVQTDTISFTSYSYEQSSPEPKYGQANFSKLNPEAPEFVPRGLAS